MARAFDTHRVAVIYRTARMAAKDAERLRSCGWTVIHDRPCVLLVDTYKPTVLFGPLDLPDVKKRPTAEEPPPGDQRGRWHHAKRRWEAGIVSWTFDADFGACGCEPWRLETDTTAQGIAADLQPVGADGKIFFGAATYVVERINWPCRLRDNRASVAVRTPDEEHWRGRSIMVAESVAVALLPNLTSAQRQCYIDTGEIPAVEDTFPVGA